MLKIAKNGMILLQVILRRTSCNLGIFMNFIKSRGNKVVRRIVKADNRIVGAYAGVVEDAKRGRYLAVAGGPIVDWGSMRL